MTQINWSNNSASQLNERLSDLSNFLESILNLYVISPVATPRAPSPIFVLKVGGIKADPNRARVEIANQAKLHGVEKIEVEPNFPPGIWNSTFNPVMNKIWPSGTRAVESDWAEGQKEVRIIDTLEPADTDHRVIIDKEVISTESAVRGEELGYSLLYQWTHITRERGCLKHDDQPDSVAGGVAALQRSLGVDAEVHRVSLLKAQRDAALERFIRAHEEGVSVKRRRKMACKGFLETDLTAYLEAADRTALHASH